MSQENGSTNQNEFLSMASDGLDVVLPSVDEMRDIEALKAVTPLDESLADKKVTNVTVSISLDMDKENYTIDMKNCRTTSRLVMRAIVGMTSERGENSVALYVMAPDGIVKVGYADRQLMYSVLRGACKDIFGDRCEVYRDYVLDAGDANKPWQVEDNSGIILDI